MNRLPFVVRWSPSFGLLTLALAILPIVLVVGAPAAGQRQINSVKGVDLYQAYCVDCHGPAGKGDGPRAAALKSTPPDLAQIALRNGGKFDKTRVASLIAGDARPGTVMINPQTGRSALKNGNEFDPMPPWGIVFRYMWPDQPVTIRTGSLAKHLESIQEK